MTMTNTRTKSCPHCEQHKSVEDFALRERGGTARQAYCRDCLNAYRRDVYAQRNGGTR